MKRWLTLNAEESALRKRLKETEAELDAAAYAKYPTLTEDDVKTLVVEDKWLATLDARIHVRDGPRGPDLDGPREGAGRAVRDPSDGAHRPRRRPGGEVNGHLERMGFWA